MTIALAAGDMDEGLGFDGVFLWPLPSGEPVVAPRKPVECGLPDCCGFCNFVGGNDCFLRRLRREVGLGAWGAPVMLGWPTLTRTHPSGDFGGSVSLLSGVDLMGG